MNLTSPSQVRALVSSIGFQPSKLLGQNFLIDRNILDIIIRSADISETDHILEVGPGLGVVTERLAEGAGLVTAVEKDKRLFGYLCEKFRDVKNVKFVNADMLDVGVDGLSGVGKLVSNLPYSVGSRIIVNMIMADHSPERMVVTVQLEVAQRIAAKPNGREYGVLSVWAQSGYDVEIVKNVSPGCFWPKPEVTSAIVSLKKHDRFRMEPGRRRLFFALTKEAFAHRRKQLASRLARMPGVVDVEQKEAAEILERIGVDVMARPENLGVDKWCELVKLLDRR